MHNIQFWPVVRAAFVALANKYWPALESAAAERGIPSPAWQYLPHVLVFDPDPISAAVLCVRSRYTAPRLYDERLQTLAGHGLLWATDVPGQYRATGAGRYAARTIIHTGYRAMASFEPAPLPESELGRLTFLLARVVETCLALREPPGKWCIRHSQKLDPGASVHPTVRIDQYFSDLAAYRDDCHLFSWERHDADGHTWETLTFIWRNQANSFDELREKLGHRGFTPEETRAALADLIRRRWIERARAEKPALTSGGDVRLPAQESYRVTAAADDVRLAAQEITDQCFNRPFDCLNRIEQEELLKLLEALALALSGPQLATGT